MSLDPTIVTSAPGRVCLFGEHQDYLGLPVIAAAIPLRISCSGTSTPGSNLEIQLTNIKTKRLLNIDNLQQNGERDYLFSALVVLNKYGYKINRGASVSISGNIPLGAGVSSSSALINAWLLFLITLNGYPAPKAEDLAKMCYEAEVGFFNEPGGKMDQYTSALGHMIYLNPVPALIVKTLGTIPPGFVLIDTGFGKTDTLTVLRNAKESRQNLIEKIKKQKIDFSLTNKYCAIHDLNLSDEEQLLLHGTLENKRILESAYTVLMAETLFPDKLGSLLYAHHRILSQILKVSTEEIDQIIIECMDQGALGGKMLGSGIGGCTLIYTPGHVERIRQWCLLKGYNFYEIEDEGGARVDVYP